MVSSRDLRLADVKIGQYGLASRLPSLQVKYVNGGTGLCLLRNSRKQYRMIWAAITFITEVRNLPFCFNFLDLSGITSPRAAIQCDSEKLRLLKLDKCLLSVDNWSMRSLCKAGLHHLIDQFIVSGSKDNLENCIGHPDFELIQPDVTETLLVEVDHIYHLACPTSPIFYKYNPVKVNWETLHDSP